MENIKTWYQNAFPSDELGSEINEKATFNGLFEVLFSNADIYDFLTVYDSIVRERVFEKLSETMKVDYNYIYHLWLGV